MYAGFWVLLLSCWFGCSGKIDTPQAEDCTNGIDDNFDGLTDCQDPICKNLHPLCLDHEICNDGLDNNGDGLTDCEDLACCAESHCCENPACCSNPDCCVHPNCQSQPACQNPDPCAVAANDGLYCGSRLNTVPADSLFHCAQQVTQSQTPCSLGCLENPSGIPDRCQPDSGECCVDVPPGREGTQFTGCAGTHYGIDYVGNVGVPIPAGITGTVVLFRTGYPNCGSLPNCSEACYQSNFNFIKIKADCGDPNKPGNDLYIYYLHIDDIAPGITTDLKVYKGDLVAYLGNSGCSSTPHIHFEVVSVPAGEPAYLHTCFSINPKSVYCE